MVAWSDCVVPLAMKLGWRDVQAGDLRVGDLGTFLVGILIKPALHGEAGLCRRAGDELDDDLMRQQWFAAELWPNLGDDGLREAAYRGG